MRQQAVTRHRRSGEGRVSAGGGSNSRRQEQGSQVGVVCAALNCDLFWFRLSYLTHLNLPPPLYFPPSSSSPLPSMPAQSSSFDRLSRWPGSGWCSPAATSANTSVHGPAGSWLCPATLSQRELRPFERSDSMAQSLSPLSVISWLKCARQCWLFRILA